MFQLLSLPTSPVFTYDLQHVPGIRNIAGVRRYTLLILAILSAASVVALALIWWGLMDAQARSFEPSLSLPAMLAQAFLIYGIGLLVLTTYTSLIPELAAIFLSSGLILTERTADRLDLLRLATHEDSLIDAKHALAVTKTWRFTVIWIVGRLFSVVGLLLAGISILFEPSLWAEIGEIPPEYMAEAPFVILVALPLLVLSIVVIVLEPLWRMQATTALGINISSRVESRTTAIILSFLGLIGLNIALSTITGVLYSPISIGTGFLFTFVEENTKWLPVLLRIYFYGAVPLFAVLAAAAVYFFYRYARIFLLRDAAKMLDRA